jgi:AcrR family transcriptional regulator
MKKGNQSPSERTFIEEAQQKQIVKHSTDVIAEHGFARVSIVQIAESAMRSRTSQCTP